jgi:hypothetical protein
MDRFAIVLDKKPPPKPSKPKKKKPRVAKNWAEFAEINDIGSAKEWIESFNSMIDPKVPRDAVKLRQRLKVNQ